MRLRQFAVRQARGYSLIEVLIALLVLGFGLLGLAFLQTINVRYTQSANHRTIATNLAYELLDIMRSNHAARLQYGNIQDSFGGALPAEGNCPRDDALDVANNKARWACEVRTNLPNGRGSVTFNADQTVTVNVLWADDAQKGDGEETTQFQVTTRL
jgi:type IV pilus assembly protein PilV